MGSWRDGGLCRGRVVMGWKEDEIGVSLKWLSCMMVCCKLMLVYMFKC